MIFKSDNWAGASPKVLQAITESSPGMAAAYGDDDSSLALGERFNALFGREVGWFLAPTGTAINALALSLLAPPDGLIYAHTEAHVVCEEAGAIEWFTQGARMVPLPGAGGKIALADLRDGLRRTAVSDRGYSRNAVLSLTQASESGTLYTLDEVTALCGEARVAGLSVHMDGARFANAVAALGCTPADLTWRAGVDVLSFGLTKNGAYMAEAVICFDPARLDTTLWRRKRSGHVISKSRFLAAQFLAMLDGDHWLDLAGQANAMASRLADGIRSAGYRLAFAVQANEVFAILPKPVSTALIAAGAKYYEWPPAGQDGDPQPDEDEVMVRLVTSWATQAQDVDTFLAALKAA